MPSSSSIRFKLHRLVTILRRIAWLERRQVLSLNVLSVLCTSSSIDRSGKVQADWTFTLALEHNPSSIMPLCEMVARLAYTFSRVLVGRSPAFVDHRCSHNREPTRGSVGCRRDSRTDQHRARLLCKVTSKGLHRLTCVCTDVILSRSRLVTQDLLVDITTSQRAVKFSPRTLRQQQQRCVSLSKRRRRTVHGIHIHGGKSWWITLAL